MHRDLKLGNLFLTKSMQLKLGDFGLAVQLQRNERRMSICGTPNYIAPEVLEGKHGHSYEADVWAIGVIAYTLLVGRTPFESRELNETYERIQKAEYSYPEHVMIDEVSKRFIEDLLQVDPAKRLQLEQVLQHDFFKENFPPLMPASTLTCPPSIAYAEKFNAAPDPPLKQEKK